MKAAARVTPADDKLVLRSKTAAHMEISCRVFHSSPCNFVISGCIPVALPILGTDSGTQGVATLRRHNMLVLLGLSSCLALTSCFRPPTKANAASVETVPVRTTEAISQDVPLEIAAVGNVEAIASVDVRSRVAGQIKSVAFQEGQSVNKGQVLFTIDPEVLRRQAAEQQAELERDAAMEQQARALVVRDAAAQKQSQSEADVALELSKAGILSRQRTDQLITASETARAALRSDQAAVEAAVGTTRADRARLSQTQLQLSFTDVVAPIGGRAGAVVVKAGNMVRENDTTLVTLLQLAPIYVTFGVPEQVLSEVQRLNAGGQLTVKASNGDGSAMEGRLVFIDNTVDATTGTIKLKAAFANTNGTLWPGGFVHLRLRLRVEKAKTIVPQASIQDGLDGKFVWRIQSGIATIVPVTVLRTYQPENGLEQAIVASGIRPGDTVVTEGQLRLTPGARITRLDTPRG
jgi:membrane fusion protein, multidrug efflux system